MSLTEGIIWLAGARVKSSRRIGHSRVFECDTEPQLELERVIQMTGELRKTIMRTTYGVMASVRIGRDVVCWHEMEDTYD